ncbi:enoyl-CoA hydratase-related protein [Nocardia callitridis]|uniref:Enoyl-CoA hydratase-related protein n=1 Tax=Nocardia callitridis TaxID=648753 RepID=A0ABP9K478_9NOCA
MPTLTYRDRIAVLDLGDTENRFSPEALDEIDHHLDTALAAGAPALLTTASGKFYSNGLDLDWLSANGDRAPWYVARVQQLLGRVLTLAVPTVAALPGHAFGAGAMLALAHDYRVMRADRGYFCLPEVDLGIRFTPGMSALIQAKLTPKTALTAMTTGRRFGGTDAEAVGLVDATAAHDAVVDTAVGLVEPLGAKDADTLADIKQTMFAAPFAALTAA